MSEQYARPQDMVGKSSWGIEPFALLQIGLFFMAMLSLDLFLFQSQRFWHANPHPFWIIVLLVNVQYGPREGMIAAFCASLALLAFNLPPVLPGQSLLAQISAASFNPLLWLATTIFLGILRGRQIRGHQSLKRSITEIENKLVRITEAYDELNLHKNKLENYASEQLGTALEFYRTARKVEGQEPARILTSALNLVNTILRPHKVSIFLLTNDMLQASIHNGWEEDDQYLRFFRPESPLFQEIVAKKRFLNVTRLQDEQILLGQGVLAGPLLDRETGEITGMLKIEKLGFLNLNLSSLKSFQLSCEWIGSLLARSRDIREAKEERAVGGRLGLHSARLYEQHSGFLRSLAGRLHFDVSEVRIQLTNPHELAAAMLEEMGTTVAKLLLDALRQTDYAFDYQRGWSYLILLPGTNLEQARVVVEKLEKGLAEAWPHKSITYVIEVSQIA